LILLSKGFALLMEDNLKILTKLLNAAEKEEYSGYSKFDALNSPLLKKISFNNKWLRLIYTQFVKEIPFHIRPLLGVNKSKNPKGVALFARANFFLYQKTSDPAFLRKGESLIHWLLENPSPGQDHLCWGYNFIWQNTLFLQDMFEPNAVVSVFVGEALIHAYRITKNEKYLTATCSVADFILKDLPVLYNANDELAIAYVIKKVDAIVLNNQILAGAFLIKVWQHTKEDHLFEMAVKLINFTVNRATNYYAWYYTYPKQKSHISHDNYHTGGILDGLIEYFEETDDNRYMNVYWKGLEYYQNNLFEPTGAPRWMNNKKFPFDIHGSAQGIITFKKAAEYESKYLDQANIISNWAVNNLYRKERHDFIYRRGRWFKWNYSLMRWCNAWMSRALAELILVS
jgi:rhamnogalacturonyl hydrolase YesR